MKSMIALTALVAAASAQIAYPGLYSYAPAFSYSNFGTPASTTKINRHVAATPLATPLAYNTPYNTPYFHPFAPLPQQQYFNPYFFNQFSAQPALASHAFAGHAFAAPAALPAAPVPTLKVAEIADADVVEAAVAVEQPEVNLKQEFTLRRIFPVFNSPLRGASDAITFARPDQVKVPAGGAQSDAADDDFVVISPELSLRYSGANVFASAANALPYALPAGIAQASQPRFLTAQPGSPLVVA